MTDLLPCPLPACGGEAAFGDTDWAHHITCTKCGLFLSQRVSKEGLIAAWNKRTHPAPTVTEPMGCCVDGGEHTETCVHCPLRPTPPSAEPSAEAREHTRNVREVAVMVHQHLAPHEKKWLEDAASYISRTPAQGAVTEEMVERALVGWRTCMHTNGKYFENEKMRAALTAALTPSPAKEGKS